MKNKPGLGQIVLWYPGSDSGQEPLPAVVSKVGMDSVCLNVIDSASYNQRIKDGVRHLDDPRAKTEYGREVGAWDFTVRDKLIDQLLREFGPQANPAPEPAKPPKEAK